MNHLKKKIIEILNSPAIGYENEMLANEILELFEKEKQELLGKIKLRDKDCLEIAKDLRKIVGKGVPMTEEEILAGYEIRKKAIADLEELKKKLK